MKSFRQYNESIKDKMLPKSEDDIMDSLEDMLPNEKLIQGAREGLLWVVKIGVEEGGNTLEDALMNSITFGHRDIVEFLLDSGADVEGLDKKQRPLIYAISNGYKDIVGLLLDRGADVHYHNECPLNIAISHKHYDIANYLIKRGADVKKLYGNLVDSDRKISVRDVKLFMSEHMIKESVRAKMTPISDEVIIRKLGNMKGYELKNYIADLLYRNDKDLISVILKDVELTRLSEYELYDLVELAIDMRNLTAVNLLLNTRLHRRFLEKLYLYAAECGYSDIANSILQLITVNEGIRDKMTPKSEEESINIMKPILFKLFDSEKIGYEDRGSNDTWNLGVNFVYSIQKKYGNHYVLNYIFDDDYKTYPGIKKIVEEWLSVNYPNWDESQIDTFWEGFCYSGVYESIRDKMTPKSASDIMDIIDRLDVPYEPYKDIIRTCARMYRSISLKRNNDHSYHYKFKVDNLIYTVACYRLSDYPEGVWRMRLTIATNEKWGRDTKRDIHSMEDIVRIVSKGEAVLNEGVRDKMTPKSYEDVLRALDKHYSEEDGEYTIGSSDLYRTLTTLWLQSDKVRRKEIEERYPRYMSTFRSLQRGLTRRMNEGVRDKMLPKSDEEIRTAVKKLLGMTGDYIEVKIPEPEEVKGVRSLVRLSDEYGVDIQDYSGSTLKVCGDIVNVFNFIKFYVDYKGINRRNSREFFIDYIIRFTVRGLNEGVRSKMTPVSGERIEDLMSGKSYRERLNLAVKIRDIGLAELVMRADAVTSEQMTRVGELFDRFVVSNDCKVKARPRVRVDDSIEYECEVDISGYTSTYPYGEIVRIGIAKITESAARSLGYEGKINRNIVFWYYAQVLVRVNQTHRRWDSKVSQSTEDIIEYLKSFGFEL